MIHEYEAMSIFHEIDYGLSFVVSEFHEKLFKNLANIKSKIEFAASPEQVLATGVQAQRLQIIFHVYSRHYF